MTLPQLKSVPSLVFDRAAAKKRNDLGGNLKKLKVCAADIASDWASDICFIQHSVIICLRMHCSIFIRLINISSVIRE